MRLFVALPLREDIQQKVASLRGGIPDAKWIPEENMHITLVFLGELPHSDLQDISLTLGRIQCSEFQIQLDSVGMFGSEKRPRILWAGVAATEPLARLRKKVAIALENSGFQIEERRFKPHITLARIHQSPYQRIRQYLSDNALFKTAPVHIDTFTLFSSHLAHSGAIHTEEMSFFLEKHPGPALTV